MNDADRVIFVFGSNLAGRHGKGAALHAREKWGAIPGKGEGLQGHSYGIATKDHLLKVRPLPEIARSVATFLAFAEKEPSWAFVVTRVGCGLAGYGDKEIAPLFKDAPGNCLLPTGWRPTPVSLEASPLATRPDVERARWLESLKDVVVG